MERTMVISKFIHVANACRRLANFGTLTQIVVGLQSQHVAGLTSTWEGLSAADKKIWQDLKELVDGGKNWSKMRQEMDAAIFGPRRKGEGCIPFLGMTLRYHSNIRNFHVRFGTRHITIITIRQGGL
jgi:Gdp/GTP exchange factor required for growth at low temperatures